MNKTEITVAVVPAVIDDQPEWSIGEKKKTELDIVRITTDNIALLDSVDDDIFDAPLEPDRINRFVSDALHVFIVRYATPS